jgi:hypothetical protein
MPEFCKRTWQISLKAFMRRWVIENRLVMLYLTLTLVMQSVLERGFRYFKVSPIKAFRDIRHVRVDTVFSTTGSIRLNISREWPIPSTPLPLR